MTLVLLVPGVGMGAGTASEGAATFVQPIGWKVGVERPDASDLNMPTGVTG